MPKDDNPRCGIVLKEGNFDELEKYFEDLTSYNSNVKKEDESSLKTKRRSVLHEQEDNKKEARDSNVRTGLNNYLSKETNRNRRSTSTNKDCR